MGLSVATLAKPTYAFLHKAPFKFQAVSNVTIALPTMTDNKEGNRLCEDLEFSRLDNLPSPGPSATLPSCSAMWSDPPFLKSEVCKTAAVSKKSLRNHYVI